MLKPLMLSALVERVKDIVENSASDFPGRKIDQIKELRSQTGFGLKEAKDIIEASMIDHFNPNSSDYEAIIKTALDNNWYAYIPYGYKLVKESEVISLKGDEYMVVWDTHSGKGHYVAPTEDEAKRFKEFVLTQGGNYWNVRIAAINWQ